MTRSPISRLAAIANSFGTFDDCLTRELEDHVKQHRQDRYQSQQTQSKNLAQSRLHDIALVGSGMSSAAAPDFFSGLCAARRGRSNLALDQPIDGEFSRPENEDHHDRKQKEKLVRRQKFVRIAENHFHASRSAVRYATVSKIISGREISREQNRRAEADPPKHSVAPARIACACGKGIPRLWKNSVGFCQIHQLALAGEKKFPAPVKPDDEEQERLQDSSSSAIKPAEDTWR